MTILEGREIYLTKEGVKDIEREYKKSKKLKEKRSQHIPLAMHSEELSSDFIAFRDDVKFLEARLRELEYILRNYKLIELPPKDQRGRVGLGALVKVEVGGQEDEYKIVGTVEANPSKGKISNESPVGKALLGAREGEEVIVESPSKTVFRVKKIKY